KLGWDRRYALGSCAGKCEGDLLRAREDIGCIVNTDNLAEVIVDLCEVIRIALIVGNRQSPCSTSLLHGDNDGIPTQRRVGQTDSIRIDCVTARIGRTYRLDKCWSYGQEVGIMAEQWSQ